jgi:hypothetical protein
MDPMPEPLGEPGDDGRLAMDGRSELVRGVDRNGGSRHGASFRPEPGTMGPLEAAREAREGLLAEDVTGTEEGDDHPTTSRSGDRELDGPRSNHDERTRTMALRQEHLAGS